MTANNPEHSNELYRRRTKAFALQVIQLVDGLPRTTAAFVMGKQLLRSATSVAANYRAMCLARRSSNEKYAKLCIVVEEADETLFWIEMLSDSGLASSQTCTPIQQEAFELAKIFTTYRSKLKVQNQGHDA